MKYYALIKKNIVEGIVFGDESFETHIKEQYDLVVDVTNSTRPSPGDSYYPDTETFISNTTSAVEITVNPDAEHLQQGTEEGFEPFQLSKYAVSYEDGMIVIGCKRYSALGFMDALHKMHVGDDNTAHCFSINNGNPGHGKFDITWEDVELLYEKLSKVKFT